MSWIKLDDHFTHHPKLVSISLAARWAYMDGLCYCAQYLTDGFIAEGQARLIASAKVRAELVAIELWHEVKSGVDVHDYLEYNPTRAQVLTERERSKRRRTGEQPANDQQKTGEQPANDQQKTGEQPANDHGKIREIRETYGG